MTLTDLGPRVLEYFSVFSRLLNVLAGGTADLTLSARAHRDGWVQTEALIDMFFRIAFGELDHCARWWKHEVERSRANVERDMQMNLPEFGLPDL